MESIVIPTEEAFEELVGNIKECRQVGQYISSFSPCCATPNLEQSAAKVTDYYERTDK